MKRFQFFLSLIITLALVACGGGGGSSSSSVPVPPSDTTAPVITLNGDNPQSVDLNTDYVEAGASTDTGESVSIDAGALDTATVGSYSVTYNATDAAGNVATEVIRTVNVIDQIQSPLIQRHR
jgi:hypothetical protein